MKRFTQKYAAFVRQPDVARLLLTALLTRMPVGMVGFAMVMFLREQLGNFTLAGTAVGINFISMAMVSPIIGRLVDLHGPRVPLLVTGIVQPLSLLGILVAARLQLPFLAVALCASLAGMFATPITTLTRTAWRHRFQGEDDRRTAFALDAVTIEVNFTLGPAIVATILAVYGATAAFATAIAAAFAAFLVFFSSPAMRYFKRGDGGERHLFGPLTEPRLWLVFIATLGLTTCFGLLEVGYPAYATSLAMPALAGVLLSVNSLGSVLGGAVFGGLHPRMRIERQFAAALALMSVPVFLHAVAGSTLTLAILAFFAGALIAPSIACQSVLVSKLAPARYATEAFTWSSTFILVGLGSGMALGGFLVETAGLRVAFATGGAVVALMALVALSITAPSVPAHPSLERG